MDSLKTRIARLRVDPEKLVSFWLDRGEFKGRVDRSGTNLHPADIISSGAIAQVAMRFLPDSNSTRQTALGICQKNLKVRRRSDWKWSLRGETDTLAAALTTGRILHDLGSDVSSVASDKVVRNSLTQLRAWLKNALKRPNPMELPLIYRAAAALRFHRPNSDLTAVGTSAQSLVHRFISYHTLNRRSQFDPTLLCVALTTDNTFAPDPLPQHERNTCLDIAFKHYEPLITSCRSTITRLGNSAAGCSALDVLSWMLNNEHLSSALSTHPAQLELTLTWLEDHSKRVDSITLFQSDLYPDFSTFDAWYNCLVLTFLDALDKHLTSEAQYRLRKELSAAEVNIDRRLEDAVCGGFKWPHWLKNNFLSKVKSEGKIPDKMGNGIVLFGPPGTGKTTLAKSIALELPEWHFIELSTADFLIDGYDNLFRSIRNIFRKLRELQRCVVFFDELELLVLERDPEKAEWSTITNVMLPELQYLHDCPALIPIFATNHVSRFDPAGRRPGRFDFILPVGLPSADERLRLLRKNLPKDYLYAGIEDLAQDSTIKELLEWARQYKASGKTGKKSAEVVWKSGFDQLRVDYHTLQQFREDIRQFSYPPAAKK
jgi:ATPase family associated with various cellular activities (AAA)